jgi:hypothetical protein
MSDPIEELEMRRFEAVCALKEAMNAVQTFHGKPAWDIYEKRAPEWQRWKRILEKNGEQWP